jgi:hypothetical protein
MRRRLIIGLGVVVVLLGVAGGAVATGQSTGVIDDDHEETPATGPEADRASAAAVDAAGGGKVTEIERDAEGGRVWKVEVTKDNGVVSDVGLDGNYQVVAEPPDTADTADTDAGEVEAEAQGTDDQPDHDADDANEPHDTEDADGD